MLGVAADPENGNFVPPLVGCEIFGLGIRVRRSVVTDGLGRTVPQWIVMNECFILGLCKQGCFGTD